MPNATCTVKTWHEQSRIRVLVVAIDGSGIAHHLHARLFRDLDAAAAYASCLQTRLDNGTL